MAMSHTAASSKSDPRGDAMRTYVRLVRQEDFHRAAGNNISLGSGSFGTLVKRLSSIILAELGC
jgi:hypothetical protein